MGYVKPNQSPFDTPRMTLVMNENWAGFMLGQLEHLLNPDKWEGTEEEKHQAVDEVLELLDYMSADCDCLDTLEWSRARGLRYYGADQNWHDVPGSKEINLYWDNATYITDTTTGSPPDSLNDNICGGVKGLVEKLLIPRYKDALDTIQLYVDGFIKLEDALVKVLSTLTLGLSEALPFDEMVGWMNSFQEFAFAQAYDVLNDPDWVEEIEENLYCAIKDAANGGTLTEAIWVDWRDFIGDTWGIQVHGTGTYMDKLEFLEVRKRYNIYTLTASPDCNALGWCPDPIPCLDELVDLTLSQECTGIRVTTGAVPVEVPMGQWISGQGYKPTLWATGTAPGSSKFLGTQIYIDFGQTVDVTNLRWQINYVSGNNMSAHSVWKFNPDTLTLGAKVGDFPVALSDGFYDHAPTITGVNGLLFVIQKNGTVQTPPSGEWYLTAIEALTT